MRASRTRVAGRIGAKLGQAVAVLALVTVGVFFILRLIPGDPARQVLGQRATPDAVAALRQQLGLDLPLSRQFGDYLLGLLHGDLGVSLVRAATPVASIVRSSLSVTAWVVVGCIVIALVVGIPLGVLAASRPRGALSILIRGGSILLLATPPFFIGLILILVFAVKLGWLPAGGWSGGGLEHLRTIVLPAVALSAYLTPVIMRTTRQAALDVGEVQFVEAATNRGLSGAVVTFRHVVPNCLLPIITLVGLNVGWLISGAVVVEAIFNLPGVGTTLAQAVQSLDYTVIQGVALLTAFVVVVANLFADVLYALVDPRVREAA